MTLEEEARQATEQLQGKVVSKVVRNRAKEVLVEFSGGSRFFIDHGDDHLDLSITGSDSEGPQN